MSIGYRPRHAKSHPRRRATLAAAVFVASLALAEPAGQPTPQPRAALRPPRTPYQAPATALRLSAAPDPVEFDIVATGDLLIHSGVFERAFAYGGDHHDFRPMFARIRPIIRGAALGICHIEGTLGEGEPTGYPSFRSPPALADAIAWAGWDVCDTASNHTLDKGWEGVVSTLDALDEAGLRHTGSSRDERTSRRTLTVKVEGVRIALLAYTYGTNGIPSPRPYAVNLISLPRIEADARAARRRGADLVLVNLHWGTEYQHEPNAQQEDLADSLLSRGVVDAIIGQHAHVVQPIERRFGRFVVFGEGNLVANMPTSRPERHDGLMAVLRVRSDRKGVRIISARYVPIWSQAPDFVVTPVEWRLRELETAGKGEGIEANVLRQSLLRTTEIAGSGRHLGPLHPPEAASAGPCRCA